MNTALAHALVPWSREDVAQRSSPPVPGRAAPPFARHSEAAGAALAIAAVLV